MNIYLRHAFLLHPMSSLFFSPVQGSCPINEAVCCDPSEATVIDLLEYIPHCCVKNYSSPDEEEVTESRIPPLNHPLPPTMKQHRLHKPSALKPSP